MARSRAFPSMFHDAFPSFGPETDQPISPSGRFARIFRDRTFFLSGVPPLSIQLAGRPRSTP